MRRPLLLLGLLLSLALPAALACDEMGGGRTKHDLLERARDVRTRDQLLAALGDPDDRHKLGPLETWIYDARDGSVSFLITGDTVRLQATGPAVGPSREQR